MVEKIKAHISCIMLLFFPRKLSIVGNFALKSVIQYFDYLCNLPRVTVLLNTLRTGLFKLFKRPFPGFLTILTL